MPSRSPSVAHLLALAQQGAAAGLTAEEEAELMGRQDEAIRYSSERLLALRVAVPAGEGVASTQHLLWHNLPADLRIMLP